MSVSYIIIKLGIVIEPDNYLSIADKNPGPYYSVICEPVILEPILDRSIGLKRVKTKDRDASKLAD